MVDELAEGRKKERSPSFPFIPLEKAVERLRAFYASHKREAPRIPMVANTWAYAPKSSGLLQTIAALKQFGLLDDVGSGEDRKIQITDLGRRIIMDERPGAREQAIREAALKPRLIEEYAASWLQERPSDSHRFSELQLERGFSEDAAKAFVRVFDTTAAYANLTQDDTLSVSPAEPSSAIPSVDSIIMQDMGFPTRTPMGSGAPPVRSEQREDMPFSKRLKVDLTPQSVTVAATLLTGAEIDKLIAILEATKVTLPGGAEEQVN